MFQYNLNKHPSPSAWFFFDTRYKKNKEKLWKKIRKINPDKHFIYSFLEDFPFLFKKKKKTSIKSVYKKNTKPNIILITSLLPYCVLWILNEWQEWRMFTFTTLLIISYILCLSLISHLTHWDRNNRVDNFPTLPWFYYHPQLT